MKFKAYEHEIKRLDENARTIEHMITTDKRDLDGDILEVQGWKLERFKKNPVVLFGHDQSQPPIARALSVAVMEHGLQAVTQFPPELVNPLADVVFALNKHGYMKTWSVGYLPKKFSPQEDGKGLRIQEQELVEYSATPVPANDDAVNLAISRGLVTEKSLKLLGWQKMQGHSHDGATADGWRLARKGATPFADLPIVEEAWNPRDVSDADLENAILGVAPGENISDRDPDTLAWDRFQEVHLWWNPEAFDAADSAQGKKDAFKLKIGRRDPITDTGGTLKVYFQQLASRIAILNGARGGVDIPAADRQGAYNHAVKYYDKLPDQEPPSLKSFSEIIQEEFSKQPIAMASEAERQRLGDAFRKASGMRA